MIWSQFQGNDLFHNRKRCLFEINFSNAIMSAPRRKAVYAKCGWNWDFPLSKYFQLFLKIIIIQAKITIFYHFLNLDLIPPFLEKFKVSREIHRSLPLLRPFSQNSTREIPKQARYFWPKLHDLSPIQWFPRGIRTRAYK